MKTIPLLSLSLNLSLNLSLSLSLPVFGQAHHFATARPEAAGFSSGRLQRVDAMLDNLVNAENIPGVVALIIRDGKIAHFKAYGYSDIEAQKAMRTDDIFRIASQSKAITSLAVMMLWEEGKFLLDDPVSKYIPEFKNPMVLKTFNPADSSFTAEPAGKEITIRQLLTHTSGIDYPAIGSDDMRAIYAKAGIPSGIGNSHFVLHDVMRELAKLPLKHVPGEKWNYGLNSDVLGYLVEVLSGMTFDRFLKERIFDPLGMKDTWFYLPQEMHDRLVSLYIWRDGKPIPSTGEKIFDNADPDFPKLRGTYFSGGAGLSSTVEDYAKFLQLFLNQGTFNGVRLLSRKTVELMMTEQLKDMDAFPLGLGFGIEAGSNDYRSVVSRGSFYWAGAYNTHYWADPQEKIIGLIFTSIYESVHWDIGERFKALVYQAVED